MNLRSLSAGLASLLVLGCGGGDKTTGVTGHSVKLSATQASALMTKVVQIAPLHSSIAWLADSANLVLRSGAVAMQVDIATNLGSGPFYAVGLQRAVQTSPNSFSTFDLIAFNDPDNPTDFIIVDGFKSGTSTPPTSVTGSFGGATVNGHLFHIAGNSISSWRASAGTATLARGTFATACEGFQGDATVTCTQANLNASFSIDLALADVGSATTDDKTAVLSSIPVPGIILNFHF